MQTSETTSLQRYLRAKLGSKTISVKPVKGDTLLGGQGSEGSERAAEISIGGEHIGEIYKDSEDGEVCYHVQITVLEEDLES